MAVVALEPPTVALVTVLVLLVVMEPPSVEAVVVRGLDLVLGGTCTYTLVDIILPAVGITVLPVAVLAVAVVVELVY